MHDNTSIAAAAAARDRTECCGGRLPAERSWVFDFGEEVVDTTTGTCSMKGGGGSGCMHSSPCSNDSSGHTVRSERHLTEASKSLPALLFMNLLARATDAAVMVWNPLCALCVLRFEPAA